MTNGSHDQIVDAIYHDGVFRPVRTVDIRENEWVRITIQSLRPADVAIDRAAVFRRIRQRIAEMNFRSTSPYPSRDELHERD